MRLETVAPGVLMFVGRAYESVATAFLDGRDALLVDALASDEDAHWMRTTLLASHGARVRVLAHTHCMDDHIAGVGQFPGAVTIAHRYHRHAYLSQDRPDTAMYRAPAVEIDGAMTLRWGPHEIHFVHNPGKTMDHLAVDVPGADLVCAGDNIVGNTVYLSKADPGLVRTAILRLRGFGRRTVIGGHMGRFDAAVLDNALHYLDRLRETVVAIRRDGDSGDAMRVRIAAIAIEDCLAPGVEPSPFERTWHGRNLDLIAARDVFAPDTTTPLQGIHA